MIQRARSPRRWRSATSNWTGPRETCASAGRDYAWRSSCFYMLVGEPRKAIAALTALEDGFRARAARMLAVSDPFFAELSAEPRYQRLLADLNLPMPPPPAAASQ